jgi:hypothetical protein
VDYKLIVKNTFIDFEPEGNDALQRGARTCLARIYPSLHNFFHENDDGLIMKEMLSNGGGSSEAETAASDGDSAEEASTPSVNGKSGRDAAHANFSFDVGAKAMPRSPPPMVPAAVSFAADEPQAPPPRDHAPEPSLGAKFHGLVDEDGQPLCTPCAWFFKVSSCENGSNCRYCHLCPKGAVKERKKAKVARLRKEQAATAAAA